VGANTFVTGVAVTLSVRSQQKDHFSKTFQQATKNPAERVAPEHLPCLEHGEHRRQQPAAADAANHNALLP
jgi:hypothetical protein